MKFRDLHESDELNDLTHEIMISHGYHLGVHGGKKSPDNWFHPSPRNLNVDDLHSDLTGAGWRRVDDGRVGDRFRTHEYRSGTKKLFVNHEMNSWKNPPHVIASQAGITSG